MRFTKDQHEFDSIRSTQMHREKSTLLHSLLSILVRATQCPFTKKKTVYLKRNYTKIERKEIQTVPTMNALDVLKRLNVLETRIRTVETENTVLKARIGTVEKENTVLKARIGTVEKENTDLKARIGTVETQNTVLNEEFKTLEQFANEAVEYMKASHDKIETMSKITTQGEIVKAISSALLKMYKQKYPSLFKGKGEITHLRQMVNIFNSYQGAQKSNDELPLYFADTIVNELNEQSKTRNEQNHLLHTKFVDGITQEIMDNLFEKLKKKYRNRDLQDTIKSTKGRLKTEVKKFLNFKTMKGKTAEPNKTPPKKPKFGSPKNLSKKISHQQSNAWLDRRKKGR